jgi:hypothetical protein
MHSIPYVSDAVPTSAKHSQRPAITATKSLQAKNPRTPQLLSGEYCCLARVKGVGWALAHQ